MIPVHLIVCKHKVGVIQRSARCAGLIHRVAPCHIHLIPVAAALDDIPAMAFTALAGPQCQRAWDPQPQHQVLKGLGIARTGAPMLRHHADHALILHIQHIVGIGNDILVNAKNFLIVGLGSGQRIEAGLLIGVHLRL